MDYLNKTMRQTASLFLFYHEASEAYIVRLSEISKVTRQGIMEKASEPRQFMHSWGITTAFLGNRTVPTTDTFNKRQLCGWMSRQVHRNTMWQSWKEKLRAHEAREFRHFPVGKTSKGSSPAGVEAVSLSKWQNVEDKERANVTGVSHQN
jgi:hypothetical protein